MVPSPIRSICVYLASSTGANDQIVSATSDLGHLLAQRGIELIYGGGAVGLMGLLADAVLDHGGRVTGVIPTGLFPTEVGHTGISQLIEVESMHARKAEMERRADAFVALPGGFGTLEEMAEILTWAQIGLHRKPIGLLNVDGFYDHLLAFFDRCIADAVLKPKNRDLLVDHHDPATLLDALQATEPAFEEKWIT